MLLFFGALTTILGLRWLGNKLLFQRTRTPYQPDMKFINGISYVYDRPQADTVIIFSHGSSGNLTWRNKIRNFFATTDYGLIMYDYYGYGLSDDVPTLMMDERCLTDAIEQVASLVSDKKIILMGASLGCFPTCHLAAKNPDNLLGTILCVPFDNINSVIPGASLLLDKYDNNELCKAIKTPTLLIQADEDEIISKDCCHNLLRELPQNTILFSVPTKHKDYLTTEAKEKVLEFISKL